MNHFPPFASRIVHLPMNDVDTDQIIPARFLKVTDKRGLADGLFADWRIAPDGSPTKGFPLNDPGAAGASILLAGNNFGCGSSREHAAWALVAYGFKAVISTSFADIFRNNALKNALLPVVVDASIHSTLVALFTDDPQAETFIDLQSQTLRLSDGSATTFPVDAFSKRTLVDGIDELGFILSFDALIREFEERHPARPSVAGGGT